MSMSRGTTGATLALVAGSLFGLVMAVGPGSTGCVDDSLFTADSGTTIHDLSQFDGGMDGLKSIRVEPADAVLYLTDQNAITQPYKAIGVFEDDSEQDITSKVLFDVDNARIGIFMGHVFNSVLGWGGKTTVTASVPDGTSGSTTLTVVFQRRFVSSNLASDTATKYGTAADDPATPLNLVYPPDGVLLPPNIVDLEIQWVPGAGQEVFEVGFLNDGTDIRIYTQCNAIGSLGCGFIPDAAQWTVIVGALKGADKADIQIRGALADLSKAGSSNTRSVMIAQEEIKGGLYYWNATPGNIVRYDFGKANEKAKMFYTAADAKAIFCVGCHALSLDGKRLAVGLDMPAPAPLKVLDVATRQVLAQGAANFMAFSPDGTKIITSNGSSMVLHDTDTLATLTPTPLAAKGTMPDWSADGSKVVYAESATTMPLPVGQPGIDKGSLRMMLHDQTANKWSSPITLVQQSGTENNYYPTFSPDNELIVFNRSAGDSYDADDASLWVVRSNLKGKPQELKLANGGTNLCNSWPKFSPFIQTYQMGKLLWVTFSSRRDYGLRLKAASGERGQAQLWMAAIDLGKDEMGTDPSYPAFWIPVQNIKTGNHIAQWTKEVVRKPCGVDGDCPDGETCQGKLCEPD